jgi:hypothetical protein
MLFRHSKRINDYFADAVRVYALRGEEDAGCAAILAAIVARKKQRRSMIEQLSKMVSNVMQYYPDKMARESIAERILFVKREVEFSDGNRKDLKEEKEKLSKMNAEYLACLNREDPSIFKRTYPNLF